MSSVSAAFVVSFFVIFAAELGDKSQLLAFALATRYRIAPVLVGVTAATALVHALSVAVGYGLGMTIPTAWLSLIAGLAFVGFAAWTLRGDRLAGGDQERVGRSGRSAVVTVAGAFLLAEFGDKTMLATITLATQQGWFGVWLGSTVGMVAADALAIVVGRMVGRRLPERTIKFGAAILFAVFGMWLIAAAVPQLTA